MRKNSTSGRALEEVSGVSLATVDEAYGPHVDLYKDVLGVKANASPEQIQRAYFDRRNELFKLLNDIDNEENADTAARNQQTSGSRTVGDDSITASHRFHAERKMDAVVMAMRILGDPELRVQYDDMRHERLRDGSSSGSNTAETIFYISPTTNIVGNEAHRHHGGSSTTSSSKRQRQHQRSRDAAYDRMPPIVEPARSYPPISSTSAGISRKSTSPLRNQQRRVVSPDQEQQQQPAMIRRLLSGNKQLKQLKGPAKQQRRDESTSPVKRSSRFLDSSALDVTDEGTVLSDGSGGTLTTTKLGFVQRARDECLGALEDVSRSFEQVVNAFTLQDEDIRAVRYRIDKAKRTLHYSV